MNKYIFIFGLLALITSSCSISPCITKDQFLKGYDTFTDKVSEKSDDYSEKQWADKEEEMDQFVDHCYKKFEDQLTDDEKKEFWVKYFKYKYDRHGRSVLKAIEADMREFEIEIDEQIENLFDNPEEDLKDIFREIYGDDIEDALDDFKRGIEDISKKIKEWLEEGK